MGSQTSNNASARDAEIRNVEPKDVEQKLKNGWSPWVLDVRLQKENDIVALPFTNKVSPHETVSLDDVPNDGDILVYCKRGARGGKACKRLVELGVDTNRLYNLDGGILRWREDIDPKMPTY